MSISTLFAPNPYNLYCKTITPSGGIPAVDTNNIDAVNPGDALNIGAVKAGVVNIGHIGIFTIMPGPLTVLGLNTDTISAANSVVMNIGANAAGINLISALGNISLDNAAPTADVLALGTLNIGRVDIGKLNGQVFIGKAGGSLTIGCPITYPGGGIVSSRFDMPSISASGTGAFVVAVPNFVLFEGYKENNVVYLRWRLTGASAAATAVEATLIMGTVIPVGFRPLSPLAVSAGVIGVSDVFYPGMYVLQPSGVHGFEYMASTHGGKAGWLLGEPCGVSEGSVMYSLS